MSQVEWPMPVISGVRRLKEEKCKSREKLGNAP